MVASSASRTSISGSFSLSPISCHRATDSTKHSTPLERRSKAPRRQQNGSRSPTVFPNPARSSPRVQHPIQRVTKRQRLHGSARERSECGSRPDIGSVAARRLLPDAPSSRDMQARATMRHKPSLRAFDSTCRPMNLRQCLRDHQRYSPAYLQRCARPEPRRSSDCHEYAAVCIRARRSETISRPSAVSMKLAGIFPPNAGTARSSQSAVHFPASKPSELPDCFTIRSA